MLHTFVGLALFLLNTSSCNALRLPEDVVDFNLGSELQFVPADGSLQQAPDDAGRDGMKQSSIFDFWCQRLSCHWETMDLAMQSEVMKMWASKDLAAFVRNHDLYEFGVYKGEGTGEKLQVIRTVMGSDAEPRHVWAFDSWQGVPRGWDFPMDHVLDLSRDMEWSVLQKTVVENINTSRPVTLVKGFYNESLTEEIVHAHAMKPAWWVNMDCDIYDSTYQALDWMFKNKLMTKGTRVYYDDVLTTSPDVAQRKAHQDITQKYNVQWKKLASHSGLFVSDDVITYLYEVVSYVPSLWP